MTRKPLNAKERLSYKLEYYTTWYNSLSKSERKTGIGTWLWGRIRQYSRVVNEYKEGEPRREVPYEPKRPSKKMEAWIVAFEMQVEALRLEKQL